MDSPYWEKKYFELGVPIIWRKEKTHTDDCYFYSVDIIGYKSKNKKVIWYPHFQSALRPVPQVEDIPVPIPGK